VRVHRVFINRRPRRPRRRLGRTDHQQLAEGIAAAPPLAIQGIKRALSESDRNDLRAQVDLESRHQVQCFLSADAAEGMGAFFEKRPPVFRGA
jgi:2-(1,2-epoxy-1,2-dihydrophenyl)acetyl-CoA isomerase